MSSKGLYNNRDIKRSKSLVKRTKSFFGVESDYSFDEIDAWNQRRLKFCVKKFGNLNYDKLKLNESQSVNAGDNESMAANTDFLDGSYQLSSTGPPANLNATFTSRGGTKRFLNSSIMSPQFSVQTYGEPPLKKQHAFRAIANVVADSLGRYKLARDGSGAIHQRRMLRSISDDVEEPIDMEFVSLKRAAAPSTIRHDVALRYDIQSRPVLAGSIAAADKKSRRSSAARMSLKWSASMVHKLRSSRRRFTDSWVGRVVCCLPVQSRDTRMLSRQIDDIPQYRPYFTYWVSIVQLIVFIASISVYGLAPIRMDLVHKDIGEVVVPSASIEQVCRLDYVNLFVGLRQADLIRLGARYSPCMRKDKNLHDAVIEEQRNRDRRSGCCIRNDGGGCYQTSEKLCGQTLSSWVRHREKAEEAHLYNSIVCGLDPEFCDQPKSMAPFLWNPDVIKWPICLTQSASFNNVSSREGRHMKCEVTGRPCCIGSKAECIVTTRQHCTFLRGYYHPEAALCSQVNCLNEICGMLSFIDPERPDQFYRLLTAIFVSSSLGSLVVTLSIQLTIMRDLEKMAGWHRICLIYMLSGIVGNLVSGIFLPYQVQTGASGCIFALLAMTFTEFLQSWKIVENPWVVFSKFLGLGIFLFILGFLPFFDNFAHMSGLLSGIILSFFLLPFLGTPSIASLQKLISSSIQPSIAYDKFVLTIRRRRLLITFGCATLWISLTAACVVFFYWLPVTQCSFCKYFNCIPIAPYFCDNMDVNITTKTACVVKD